MKENLVPIGKMASINHVTIPALRLYDQIGLLKPAWIDPESGYRYYDLGQNARLDTISYMKELGMSLDEIKDVLKKEDVVLIEEILARKNEQLHQQMRELKSRHDAVERAIASMERYRKSPLTGTISLEYIDRRRIWGIPCSRNFYESGLADFEHVQNELREALYQREISQVHSYNVGTSIMCEHFLQKEWIPKDVFIFVDEHFPLKEETTLLDSGMHACIYLDGFEEEEEGAVKLLQYCRRKQYRIVGDYICEVLTEFNVFHERKRQMFIRLQAPVAF